MTHEGRTHVYFQNSPRPDGFDTMRWAHVVSADLLRWTALPDALIPDRGGPDAHGCWTGCVLRHEGRFHAFYTGVAEPGGRVQTVCHAESDDLIEWRKDPANPVVRPGAPFATGPEAAWRDPQVRVLPEGGFEMVLTAELAHGPRALRGCMARLTSPDLRQWAIDGVLHHPGDVHRCECPEVVPWGGRLALLYSAFGVEARVADAAAGPWERPAAALLDDFRWYGAKTTLDGPRRVVLGFVFDRIAPRDSAPHDGSPWTWGGVMGFPRELTRGPDGAPALRPVEELDALRVAAVPSTPDLEGSRGHWQVGPRGGDAGIAGEARPGCEELAVLRMGRHPQQVEVGLRAAWGPHGSLGLVLQADGDLATGYHVVLDRARADVSLRRLIPHANPASPYLQRMPLPLDLGDRVTVRALLDRTVLELYIDDRVVFTSRLYERPAEAWWGLTTRAAVRVRDLECWRLGRPEAD